MELFPPHQMLSYISVCPLNIITTFFYWLIDFKKNKEEMYINCFLIVLLSLNAGTIFVQYSHH